MHGDVHGTFLLPNREGSGPWGPIDLTADFADVPEREAFTEEDGHCDRGHVLQSGIRPYPHQVPFVGAMKIPAIVSSWEN